MGDVWLVEHIGLDLKRALKIIKADIADVRAGRMTPQQFIASGGNDWRRSLEDRAEFFELSDELRLTLDIDGAMDEIVALVDAVFRPDSSASI